MRSSAFLAFFVGACFLCFVAAMPAILTLQVHTTLAPYGLLDKVDVVVQTALDDLKITRIIGAITSVILMCAGVLIALRRKSGYYLQLGICSIAVAEALFMIMQSQFSSGTAIARAIVWACMMTFFMRRERRHGAGWWRQAALREVGSEAIRRNGEAGASSEQTRHQA